MSSNSSSKTQVNSSSANLVLKHRIVGAAIILFFGALVLPWLLGAPSTAEKDADAKAKLRKGQDVAMNQELREELLASLDDQQTFPTDQVYISKITPSNGKNSESATSSSTSEMATTRPASSAEAVKQKIQTVVKSKVKPRVDPPVKKPATVITSAKAVTVGWVVQVGVFTDEKGVVKVLKDLKGKGFSPSTTAVDTNRGKGTRIWLGPYEQRIEAAQMITRLSKKTGESGFIRAYP